MNDVWGPYFEDNRVADLVGDVRCLDGGIRDGVLGRYETVGLENFLRFGLANLTGSLPEVSLEDGFNFVAIDGEEFDDTFRSCLPADVINHNLDGENGGLGGIILRNFVVPENDVSFGDFFCAEETGEDRFAGFFLHDIDNSFSSSCGVGHCLRRKQYQHRINIGVVEDDVNGKFITVGKSIAEDINGIVEIGCGGKLCGEAFFGLVG